MAIKTSQRPLWIMLFLFATPLIAAIAIYFNIDQLKFNTTQQGNFIRPTFNLPIKTDDDQPNNTWKIVYMEPRYCGAECKLRKYELGQLHKALGKNQARVTVSYLARNTLRLPKRMAANYKSTLKNNNIIIVDPSGQAMMYYNPTTTTSAVMKDMRNLLKNSRIG